MTPQHAGLTIERWAQFDFGRQILMIANELHRARQLTTAADFERRRSSLERVYALVDLTIAANPAPRRRRELLRWREQLGVAYLAATAPELERTLLRVLLQLSPAAAVQIPFVAGIDPVRRAARSPTDSL
ncbi:MAG: hypothetical protein ACREI7_10695, partial [Myxococcota bacterium]